MCRVSWQLKRCTLIGWGLWHTSGKWCLITDLSFPPNGKGSTQHGALSSIPRWRRSPKPLVQELYWPSLTSDQLIACSQSTRRTDLCWDSSWMACCHSASSRPPVYYRICGCSGMDSLENVDHYLDDFITWGPAGSDECKGAICRTCADLGVPLAMEKLEGPVTQLTLFLGIEIDTAVLRLPLDKLARVRTALWQWSHWRSCTKRQFQSLIGSLQHACKVIKPGPSCGR